MMLGVAIWAVIHLAANGDLASVLLFGVFGLYALAQLLWLAEPVAAPPPQPRHRDLILVAAGLVAYGVALALHGAAACQCSPNRRADTTSGRFCGAAIPLSPIGALMLSRDGEC